MKVELSIQANYFPEWGVWEGVRELVANARDAEREFSAPLTVRHRKEGGVLILENEGATLPHEALLLGFTTKQGQSEMIGRFGEGLKGGVLALVRAGLAVKIRSGSEVWTPSIQRSEKFNANVLVFDIEKGRKEQDRVAVEIGSVTVEAWEKFRQLFWIGPSVWRSAISKKSNFCTSAGSFSRPRATFFLIRTSCFMAVII